jgi:hypothetical protein
MAIDIKKYSKKIEVVLSSIDLTIHSFQKYNIIPSDNPIIKNMYDAIKEAYNYSNDIQLIESSELHHIHNKNDYPLSYIFFKTLKELELMDRIYPMTPDITDIKIFIEWYRENIHALKIDKIHKLLKDIKKTDDHTFDSLNDIYNLIYEPVESRKILHDQLYSNNFISLDIQHDLESSDLEYSKYIVNNRHEIKIFKPKKNITMTDNPDIMIISKIIDIMERIAIKNKNKNIPIVNLTILFSNQKKLIYPKTKILCCDNINSGSTYPKSTIVCWRREELYKVLIHELFHYHEFDFYSSDPYYSKLENMIKIPQIKGIDMLNEAYTESATIIILSIIQFVSNKISLSESYDVPYDVLYNFMSQYIKKEITFLLFQIAKIMVLFDSQNINNYINNNVIINQNTSFRSYFIIKMILLFNINDLIKMMNVNLNIKNKRLIEFGSLINKSWNKFINKNDILDLINKFIMLIKSKFTENNNDIEWVYKTCRMSVNDIISQ